MEEQKQPTPQLPERVSLATETINEILGVFSQMPYREVANIITKIQQDVQPLPDMPSATPVNELVPEQG